MPVAASLPATNGAQPVSSSATRGPGDVPFWRCGVILAMTLAMLVAEWINPSVSIPSQSGVVMALPDVVALNLPGRTDIDFHGTKAAISEGELGVLPKDTELVRKQYDDFEGRNSILCTLLLSGAEQRSIHRPEVCLPGQGWTVVGQDYVTVPLASGHDLEVRKLSIQRDASTPENPNRILHADFLYWFVGENTTTASQFMRVFLSSWDRIVHNRAHRWAYVMVMAPVTASISPDGLNEADTQKMLTDFIRQVVPTFQKSEMPDQAAK